MSLFTPDEVCKDCYNAEFHECCGRFCKCTYNEEIDPLTGKCEMYRNNDEARVEEAMRDQLHIMFPGRLALDHVVKRCVEVQRKLYAEAASRDEAYSKTIAWIQEHVRPSEERGGEWAVSEEDKP